MQPMDGHGLFRKCGGSITPNLRDLGVTYPFWPPVFSSVKYKYWMKRSFHQSLHHGGPIYLVCWLGYSGESLFIS